MAELFFAIWEWMNVQAREAVSACASRFCAFRFWFFDLRRHFTFTSFM
jgi:hypothetical protein